MGLFDDLLGRRRASVSPRALPEGQAAIDNDRSLADRQQELARALVELQQAQERLARARVDAAELDVAIAARQPSCTSPMTSRSGTKTSSKKISPKPVAPPSCSMGRTVTPSVLKSNIR